MFEHMKNYRELLKRIASWLKPEGCLFVHIFAHKNCPYHFESDEDKDSSDESNNWMARHFFTGGTMPSDDLLLYFQDDLKVEKHWVLSGCHYTKTLESWLVNMDNNRERVRSLFEQTYGPAQVAKWEAYWRTFYMACSEMFNYNNGQEWFISHYLFTKPSMISE